MKISACVIVKNEEKSLARCLKSLEKSIDEIIVVDTGSTDKSILIAKEFGAKVYEFIWQDDFALAKNFAKSKASGDWIIFLDADEYFANDKINNIQSIIEFNEAICDAFMFRMINVDADDNDRYIDEFYTMRAFKNIPELLFKNKIHEELVNISGKKTRLLKIDEGILLYHTGYSKDKIRAKCERNLAILLNQLTGGRDDQYVYRYLADAYMGISDYENALKYAQCDVATGKKELTYASRSYRIINRCLKLLTLPDNERKTWFEKSIKAFPELPDFYAHYGYFLYTIEKYSESAEKLLQSFRKSEIYDGLETSTFKNNIIDYYIVFANICFFKNDYDCGIKYYLKAININKFYIPAFYAWCKGMLEIYNHDKIINILRDKYSTEEYWFVGENIKMLTHGKVYESFIQENYPVDYYQPEKVSCFSDIALAMVISNKSTEKFYFSAKHQKILDAYHSKHSLNFNDFDLYLSIFSKLKMLKTKTEILMKFKNVKNKFSQEQLNMVEHIWRN